VGTYGRRLPAPHTEQSIAPPTGGRGVRVPPAAPVSPTVPGSPASVVPPASPVPSVDAGTVRGSVYAGGRRVRRRSRRPMAVLLVAIALLALAAGVHYLGPWTCVRC